MKTSEKRKKGVLHKLMSAAGIVLCAVFGSLLICNIVIIVKGTVHPETPPSVLGTTPMAVLSGSMSGTADDHIEAGDLIFIGKADTDRLSEGDVIAFMEEGSSTVVTHRIIGISVSGDGSREFETKGDANNIADPHPVGEDSVVGIYKARIPHLGDFAIFLHEPLGMALFIGIPLILFVLYDIWRRKKQKEHEKKLAADMEAEIERLRALAESRQGGGSAE